MPRFPVFDLTTRAFRLIALGLALLVALQGIATVALSARGSLHTHAAATAPTILALEDVRRGPTRGTSAIDGAALRHGHAHGADAALRHRHADGDTSVVLADGEAALHAGDVDDGGFGASLGAFLALVPSVGAWLPRGARDVAASRLAWVPQTHHPEPLERPPRSV